MALRLAIDTNTYADFLRGESVAVDVVQSAFEIFMPFVVLAELRGGFRYGDFEEENERDLQSFLVTQRVSILFADDATTRFYAEIYSHMRTNGTPIPTNDIWIGAVVVQHGLTLFTRDRHFDVVPRLPRL